MYQLVLNGPNKGVKKISSMKNPDILSSVVHGKIYTHNRLYMKTRNNTVFFYHSYHTDNLDGRWFSDYDPETFKFDTGKKLLTYIIPEYEEWDSNKIIKNVKVVINFSERGWTRLNNFLDKVGGFP